MASGTPTTLFNFIDDMFTCYDVPSRRDAARLDLIDVRRDADSARDLWSTARGLANVAEHSMLLLQDAQRVDDFAELLEDSTADHYPAAKELYDRWMQLEDAADQALSELEVVETRQKELTILANTREYRRG